MCGIVGFVSQILTREALNPLLESMHNRGPNGTGRYCENAINLGMSRLSIIDLENGNQPLFNQNKQIIAFQNGEIYNHALLRKELERAGYKFITSSDTEVIAHGYDYWGIDRLLKRLDGMFAIAILDKNKNILHLCRDKFGEKPLFYSQSGMNFGYGSTLLSVSSFPWVSDKFNPVAIDRYLATHFISGEVSIFEGVKQVLPGHRLELNLNTHVLHSSKYYEIPLSKPRNVHIDELRYTIEQAVTSRLVADVPVGVFLSGGLDSSLVAAIAAKENPNISTFSMGFEGGSNKYDESEHAKRVAEYIGSTHHEFRFDQKQFMQLMPQVAANLDTPIGDQATLPLFWLAKEAVKHVTVALSGEAADEVFCGYGYYSSFANNTSSKNLSGIKSFLSDNPAITPSGFPLLMTSHDRLNALGLSELPVDHWEGNFTSWLDSANNELQRASAADFKTWLPDDLLVKFDRMSMAHSLEGRAPFLSPEIVELGLHLPQNQRMGSTSKVALREAATHYLPPAILNRPKQGFVLPMKEWILTWFNEMGGIKTYFSTQNVPCLNMDYLGELIKQDINDGIHRERFIFAVILLCEWWAAFSTQRLRLSLSIQKQYMESQIDA